MYLKRKSYEFQSNKLTMNYAKNNYQILLKLIYTWFSDKHPEFVDIESINGMDTKDLFQSLDLNNNGNIEPTEIDDSLKGKIVSS